MKNEKENPGIEECFERLEDILTLMEKEDTGLEDSFRLYEEGMKLIRTCGENIEHVEHEIRVLSEKEET